jgi:hypothetical protein
MARRIKERGWRWAKMRDGQTKSVDCGVRRARKAYAVGAGIGKKAEGDGDEILSDMRSVCPSVVGPGEGGCEVMKNLCARMGTEKILTIPYAPQTDGMVEVFSATLCRDLTKFSTNEEDLDRNLAFAVFRYNAT